MDCGRNRLLVICVLQFETSYELLVGEVKDVARKGVGVEGGETMSDRAIIFMWKPNWSTRFLHQISTTVTKECIYRGICMYMSVRIIFGRSIYQSFEIQDHVHYMNTRMLGADILALQP